MKLLILIGLMNSTSWKSINLKFLRASRLLLLQAGRNPCTHRSSTFGGAGGAFELTELDFVKTLV